jgi:cytochrome c-type biogenesis protein CcsB
MIKIKNRKHKLVARIGAAILLCFLVSPAGAYQVFSPAAHYQGNPDMPPPVNVLVFPEATRQAVGTLIVQDFQGRMQPMDTLARALVRKITKQFSVEGYQPTDLYLSWLANPQYWWEKPLIYVRFPGLKEMLGVEGTVTHVSARSLFDSSGNYRLKNEVDQAYRTPDRDRSKLQRKLMAFDERLNMVFMAVRGKSFRVFPLPGDVNQTWANGDDAAAEVRQAERGRYQTAYAGFLGCLQRSDSEGLLDAIKQIENLQMEFGGAIVPGTLALKSELLLNKLRPLSRVLWGYLVASVLLMAAYFWSLARAQGAKYSRLHPFYLAGFGLFLLSFGIHLVAFVMRWVASGRAPLANGYESLVFISLAVGLAGLVFELKGRRGDSAGLSGFLAFVIIGLSMMSFFDPAIGLLVPVLNSYWLNIHVTIITASYGFLGLGSLVGALMLFLYLFKGPGRTAIRNSIKNLENLLFNLNIFGLGLLTIGTLLGGIWANESWGRYWGWDPKETWSLVTILTYTVVSHIRLIPAIRKPWALAAGSFAGISTVIMTFFGVNYFLQGLHSYAQGGAMQVPSWVYFGAAFMAVLIVASLVVAMTRDWNHLGGKTQTASTPPGTAN